MSSPASTKGAHCAECRGHRLHQVVTLIEKPNGKTTRNMVCTACETTTRLGVCCPKCGDVRLKQFSTRHRGQTTVRVKQCRSCGHKIRTREFVESGAAATPAGD